MKKIIMLIMSLVLSVSLLAGTRGITQDGYIFTATKEQMDQVVSLLGDKPAFAKKMTQLQNAGAGGFLKAGLKVEIMESTWGGLVKIRLVGDTFEVWTVREAVKTK